MVLLIAGASHAGKTALAQKILIKYGYPYLSIDHLKMGLIRSGNTTLTPLSETGELTAYLWPIVREMIKTAIENQQNLVVEGCYIPFNWDDDFTDEYRQHIRYCCLVMSDSYIRNHFDDIRRFANVVEQRADDEWCTLENILEENAQVRYAVQKYGVNHILIDDTYPSDPDPLL